MTHFQVSSRPFAIPSSHPMADHSPDLRTTALAHVHPRYGAKLIGFGGWLMPVQYTSILAEHEAVRSRCGLFDISHMGEFHVSGKDAKRFLNSLLTNDLSKLTPGKGQYTLLTNSSGGVIDDLIAYQTNPESFLLVVNAARINEDWNWIAAHKDGFDGDVTLEDQSDTTAALALQGPAAADTLAHYLHIDPATLPRRNHLATYPHPTSPITVARTGYTGEDGFELIFPTIAAESHWTDLLASGAPWGLIPCGLGARDTLRLEMGFPLNGSDLSPHQTPIEAGLSRFVSLSKSDHTTFPGHEVLAAQVAQGTEKTLCGLVTVGKTPPPRPHYTVLHQGEPVGETTSGTSSPSLKTGIALAYLPTPLASVGTVVEIDIRGTRFPAEVCKPPFLRR
jgi:aminomethyltransferase